MDCNKLHSDIEKLKSLRDEFASKLEDATASGLGKAALSTLSHEVSNTADEMLEHYAKELTEQDEEDENYPNAEFIKKIKERLGYITDDTTIDQIRNNLTKYLKHDLDLSSNLLTYALKEKSESNQKELDSIFNQLNLEPDKISEIMERVKNLEVLETDHYIMMLPKDKWENGKIPLPNPNGDPSTPEYIAPVNLTAILRKPVDYDWKYETNGKEDKDPELVYDESWVGKEIRHFPWSKELIEETEEKLLEPNGYHIPADYEWVSIYNNLQSELAKEQNTDPEQISDEDLSAALTERLRLVRDGFVRNSQQKFAGDDGNYWSSSTDFKGDIRGEACSLYFGSDNVSPESFDDRYFGSSIRCVAG